MRMRVLAIALGAFAAQAQALEVWLASTESCNSCAIYERAVQARGYGWALRYPDRGGLTIPILSIDKHVLAADVASQLPDDLGPRSPNWEITLLVLVMDAGRVLTAGNIAESADNNELRQPHAVMFPPDAPADDDASLRGTNLYSEFFASHWNLEYFVDVALGKRSKRTAGGPIDLAAPMPAALGPSNVILWGSAGTPLASSLFIPTRMKEIRAALEAVSPGALRYVTLYGHGPNVPGNDTSYITDGRVRFERADLDADYAADAAGLNAVLTGVLRTDSARTLLVQVGHSGPAGAPLWGHGVTLVASDLEPIKRESTGELVMVSGACMSGQFAKAVQCGFFAAHPDVVASGCQLSPEALESSDDYLRYFFAGATDPGATAPSATLSRRNKNKRNAPALYDAHWSASTRLEDHALSYTTTDALIDDYFAAHPDRLPASLTVAEIRDAARTLPRAESDAAIALTAGLAPELAIPLTGYVEANHAADAKLAEARELSSKERNRLLALPYKLMLSMLARRIAYAGLGLNDPDFALAASCERQSLSELFGVPHAQ
jgi:hypothetical protein